MGLPNIGWFMMENTIETDAWGASISGNIYIIIYIYTHQYNMDSIWIYTAANNY